MEPGPVRRGVRVHSDTQEHPSEAGLTSRFSRAPVGDEGVEKEVELASEAARTRGSLVLQHVDMWATLQKRPLIVPGMLVLLLCAGLVVTMFGFGGSARVMLSPGLTVFDIDFDLENSPLDGSESSRDCIMYPGLCDKASLQEKLSYCEQGRLRQGQLAMYFMTFFDTHPISEWLSLYEAAYPYEVLPTDVRWLAWSSGSPGARASTTKDFIAGIDAEPSEVPTRMKMCLVMPITGKNDDPRDLLSIPLLDAYIPTLASTLTPEDCRAFTFSLYLGFDAGDKLFDNNKYRNRIVELAAGLIQSNITSGCDISITTTRSHNPHGYSTPAWFGVTRQAYVDECEYIYTQSDDMLLLTDGWATKLTNILQTQTALPNFGCVVPHDLDHGPSPHFGTYNFVHRIHMDIFNQAFYPPFFPNWRVDQLLSELYRPWKSAILPVLEVEVQNHVGVDTEERFTGIDPPDIFYVHVLNRMREHIKQWLRQNGPIMSKQTGDDMSRISTEYGDCHDCKYDHMPSAAGLRRKDKEFKKAIEASARLIHDRREDRNEREKELGWEHHEWQKKSRAQRRKQLWMTLGVMDPEEFRKKKDS